MTLIEPPPSPSPNNSHTHNTQKHIHIELNTKCLWYSLYSCLPNQRSLSTGWSTLVDSASTELEEGSQILPGIGFSCVFCHHPVSPHEIHLNFTADSILRRWSVVAVCGEIMLLHMVGSWRLTQSNFFPG